MQHDVDPPECGFTWTTTTAVKGQRVEHVHRCQRPAGHDTTWHGCTADVDGEHVIERRAALRDSAA